MPINVLRIKPRRAQPLYGRHPWVFESAIAATTGQPAAGAAVVVRSAEDQFIAHGLFNPHSKIRVRLYSWDEAYPIDADLVRRRLRAAKTWRDQTLGERAAGRVCFSEADGLSGLTIDRYGDVIALQWTSLALAQFEADVIAELHALYAPRAIVRRTEKGIGELEGLQTTDEVVHGQLPDELIIEENGLHWRVEVRTGQKTGYYLDQRENRLAVSQYAAGRSVLDVYCHTGGFGLTALKRGGAASVLGIDSSASAIEMARSNADRNGLSAEFVVGDASPTMQRLHAEGRRFGLVILDPPKFARSAGNVERAFQAYGKLHRQAISLLAPDGVLAACCCSGLVAADDFVAVLGDAARQTGRPVRILERRTQAPDHPISVFCPETEYLKCIIANVGGAAW